MKNEAIIQEFEGKLKEYTRTAACKRRFVHVERLLDWLRSPVEAHVSHADRLLHVAYSETDFTRSANCEREVPSRR